MGYKIENEELQIASCSIADLTAKQTKYFLDQWEEGATLGELTVFFEQKSGLLVLNRDNPNFEFYKELAEKFITLDESERAKLIKEAPESMKEAMSVLNNCVKKRMADTEINRALYNVIPEDADSTLVRITRLYHDNPAIVATVAFRFGMMQGKRMERARRKH